MQFEELIGQISQLLDIPLEVEDGMSCSIRVDDKWILQLEVDSANNRLIICAYICMISPGKFRENVLFQTLKANALPIRIGTFGFLESSGELIFFHFLSSLEWEIEKVSNFLKEFIYIGSLWFDAIEAGRSAPTEFLTTPLAEKNQKPFGLKP